jgi:hypothetical protein
VCANTRGKKNQGAIPARSRTELTAEEQAAWDALGMRYLGVLSAKQQGRP